MRLLPLLLTAALPLLAPSSGQAEAPAPAAGEEAAPLSVAAPGPVERLLLAARLFAAGVAGRDGLTQIAAARIAGAITLQPLDLKPQISGPKAAKPDLDALPSPLPDAATMLAAARQAVETDETLGILLASTETTAEVLPKAGLRSLDGALAPGQSHSYRLPADGGALIEIAALADQPLQIEVATETGLLCKATQLCRVTLPESGYLSISLANTGTDPTRYLLLTN